MGEINLNLGCGKRLVKGFINIDTFDFAKKGYEFIRSDVRKLPFEDGSVDYILAYQVLEHLPINDIASTLKEWFRVLKKGGRMVVTCPNFDDLATEWTAKIVNKELDQEVYLDLTQHIYGNQLHEGETHKTPMNPYFLNACMNQSGFEGWNMSTYPKYNPAINYPGIDNAGQFYSCGQVHIDATK